MSFAASLGSVANNARITAQQSKQAQQTPAAASSGSGNAAGTSQPASTDSFVSAKTTQGLGQLFEKFVNAGRETLQRSPILKSLAPAGTSLYDGMTQGHAPAQNRDLDAANRRTLAPLAPQSIDVTRDPAFQALPLATQEKLMCDSLEPSTEGLLQQVAQHPLYGELSTPQKTQLLNVFASADERGRAALPVLMGRQVLAGSGPAPETTPALLSGDNTKQSTSLLENLDRLAKQNNLRTSLSTRRSEVLGRVIEETADPRWHIDQGDVGTCASTAVQLQLVQHSPSEYARLLSGLLGRDGHAVLADGQKLWKAQNDTASIPTVPDPVDPTKRAPDGRSVTERVFQSALQQFGTQSGGGASVFDANTDNTGHTIQESASILSAIYNQKFTVSEVDPPGGAYNVPGAFLDLKEPIYFQIERDLRSGHGPVRAGLLSGEARPDGSYGGHAVLITDIREGRVFFRNPHGSRANPDWRQPLDARNYPDWLKDGAEFQNPPRRIHDSQAGIESMSIDDFKGWLKSAASGVPLGGQR